MNIGNFEDFKLSLSYAKYREVTARPTVNDDGNIIDEEYLNTFKYYRLLISSEYEPTIAITLEENNQHYWINKSEFNMIEYK